MRKKPKKQLTPLQENRLLKIGIALIAMSIIWLAFAPGTGIYSLLKLRSRAEQLEVQTEKLIESNNALRAEIDRLKNDPEYLEQIARERYGLLRKNEQLFDFSQSQKETPLED